MRVLVLNKIKGLNAGEGTDITLERLVTCMNEVVTLQVIIPDKRLVTLVTLVGLDTSMPKLMP